MAFTMVCTICSGTACLISKKNVQKNQAWVAIGYAASEKGANSEAGLLIGAIGLWESSLHGAAIGSAISPGAGTVAGIVVGL